MKKPDPVHEGKTWRDMPGSDADQRRFNFSLWKRGKFQLPTPERSEAQSRYSRSDVVYAVDAEALHGELARVRRERGLTVYGQAKLISDTTDQLSFGPFFRQLRKLSPMSEKVAGVVREWLSEQKEDAA